MPWNLSIFWSKADRQIGQLSGGQFQRVLICRWFKKQRSLLWWALAGIDPVSEDIITQSHLKPWKGKARPSPIVHHDLSKVPAYFDQILLLHRKLIAFGENRRNLYQREFSRSLRPWTFYRRWNQMIARIYRWITTISIASSRNALLQLLSIDRRWCSRMFHHFARHVSLAVIHTLSFQVYSYPASISLLAPLPSGL